MITTLLIDLDGVIIQARHKYFSQRLSEEHNIPSADIMEFFKNEYGQAARGKVNIREVLPKYLAKWGWSGDLDSFLRYWFEGEKEVDQSVIEAIQSLRANGVRVYIASDNEQQRAEYLTRELRLNDLVDGAFYSYQLGCKKSDAAFFDQILTRLSTAKEEVLFIDDDPENVQIATEYGLAGRVYQPGFEIERAAEFQLR